MLKDAPLVLKVGSVAYDASTARHLEKVLLLSGSRSAAAAQPQLYEPTIPPRVSEFYIRYSAERAAPMLYQMVLSNAFPDVSFIRSLVRLCWACASGRLELLFAPPEELHKAISSKRPPPTATRGSANSSTYRSRSSSRSCSSARPVLRARARCVRFSKGSQF